MWRRSSSCAWTTHQLQAPAIRPRSARWSRSIGLAGGNALVVLLSHEQACQECRQGTSSPASCSGHTHPRDECTSRAEALVVPAIAGRWQAGSVASLRTTIRPGRLIISSDMLFLIRSSHSQTQDNKTCPTLSRRAPAPRSDATHGACPLRSSSRPLCLRRAPRNRSRGRGGRRKRRRSGSWPS